MAGKGAPNATGTSNFLLAIPMAPTLYCLLLLTWLWLWQVEYWSCRHYWPTGQGQRYHQWNKRLSIGIKLSMRGVRIVYLCATVFLVCVFFHAQRLPWHPFDSNSTKLVSSKITAILWANLCIGKQESGMRILPSGGVSPGTAQYVGHLCISLCHQQNISGYVMRLRENKPLLVSVRSHICMTKTK